MAWSFFSVSVSVSVSLVLIDDLEFLDTLALFKVSDVFRGRVISEERCGWREKTIQHALGLPSAKEEWKPFVWKILEFLDAFFLVHSQSV